jgi:hypothetical protein
VAVLWKQENFYIEPVAHVPLYRAEEAPEEPEPIGSAHKLGRLLGRKGEGARLESDATRPLLMARTPRGA